jgi:hypothetical protein
MGKYIIEYSTGPGTVGPFPSRDDAVAWANEYADQYAAMNGPLTLGWTVKVLMAPDSLVWW